MWQVGRWSRSALTANLPPSWGRLRGFSVSGGRDSNRVTQFGFVARVEFEAGAAWTDFSHTAAVDPGTENDPVRRADGIAIRWAPPGVTWAKGPPAIFAGHVVDAEIRYTAAGGGAAVVVAHVTCEDWLVSANRAPLTTAGVDLAAINGAYQAIRALAHGGYPTIRLGSNALTGVNVSGNALDSTTTRGDLIRLVTTSSGTEAYMRHGERLDPTVPAADPSATLWTVTEPEVVVRLLDEPSTFDAGHVIVKHPETDQAVYAGAPIARRYAATRGDVTVSAPDILDRVRLTSQSGMTVAADGEVVSLLAARSSLSLSGLVAGSSDVLWSAAARYRDKNTQAYRDVEVVIPSLSAEEITYWASVGIGDEITLPAFLGLGALADGGDADDPFVGMIRRIGWDVAEGDTDLTLGLALYESGVAYTPPPAPIPDTPLTPGAPVPVIYWSGMLGVGEDDDSDDTGWSSVGLGDYGVFTDTGVDTPDGEAVLDALRWAPLSTSLQFWADTAADAARLDGLWLDTSAGFGGVIRQVLTGRQMRITPTPGSVPWSAGDWVAVSVSDVRPDAPPAATAIHTATLTVGESGSDRGWLASDYGDISDDRVVVIGGEADLRMIRYTGGDVSGDNLRIGFTSAADAELAEGLWVVIGDIVHRLAAADRTGASYDFRTVHAFPAVADTPTVEVWGTDPAAVTPEPYPQPEPETPVEPEPEPEPEPDHGPRDYDPYEPLDRAALPNIDPTTLKDIDLRTVGDAYDPLSEAALPAYPTATLKDIDPVAILDDMGTFYRGTSTVSGSGTRYLVNPAGGTPVVPDPKYVAHGGLEISFFENISMSHGAIRVQLDSEHVRLDADVALGLWMQWEIGGNGTVHTAALSGGASSFTSAPVPDAARWTDGDSVEFSLTTIEPTG